MESGCGGRCDDRGLFPFRPGWGEGAEAGDDAGQDVQHVVDLLRRVVVAHGEPHATARQVFGDAHRGQHVRGSSEPDVQAEPLEAAMPARSSAISTASPSMNSKQNEELFEARRDEVRSGR